MSRSLTAAALALLAGTTMPMPDAPSVAQATGIPERAVVSYVTAANRTGAPWQLVAAIGYVESGHCGTDGRTILADGRPNRPIYGPDLGGPTWTGEFAWIKDTDGGALDGRTEWDRAVGCTQFLPSTWQQYQCDGDNDGTADPQDLDDEACATGLMLAANGDLNDPAVLRSAILGYNPDSAYVRKVLAAMADFVAQWPGTPQTGPTGGLWMAVRPLFDKVGQTHRWNQVAAKLGIPVAATTRPTSSGPVDPAGELATVQGITVDRSIAGQLDALLTAARADGFRLGGSGWRSTETQRQLRIQNGCPDIDSAPASACRVPTAIPGRSNHEIGLAVDFNENGGPLSAGAVAWLDEHGPGYGFLPCTCGEPWHRSPDGH